MQKIILTKDSELPDLSGYQSFYIDTETSGLQPYLGDRICGIAINPRESEIQYYIPIRHIEDNADINLVLPWLRELAADPSKTWIGHNIKFDLHMLRQDNIEVTGNVFDTMVAFHVHDGARMGKDPYALDSLSYFCDSSFKHEYYEKVEEYLKATQKKFESDEGKVGYNYSLIPAKLLGPYALEDLDATKLVYDWLQKNMKFYTKLENFGLPSRGTRELLANEMKLVKELFEIESRGCPIDLPKAVNLQEKTHDEIATNHKLLERLGGFSFYPSKYTQTAKAFENAGGKVKYWTKKKELRGKQKAAQITQDKEQSTGRPNWNAVSILNYVKEFTEAKNQNALDFVLAYRESESKRRLLTTYVDKFVKHVDARGMLHGQFHQHRTITGRLSSSDPLNLQNFPSTKGNADLKAFEDFMGGKDAELLSRKVRELFSAPPGYQFVTIDASQIEYRAAAFFSQDEILLKKYQTDPKTDYHTATAELVGIDRDTAKTVNFLLLYGGGSGALAATLQSRGVYITKQQAQGIIDKVFAARPAIKRLINDVSRAAERAGYIQNPLGRVCHVPRELSYIALNYLIQGYCGDLMRLWIVNISKLIRERELKAILVCSVHDELDYLIPNDRVEIEVPLLMQEMCKCEYMNVPLLADCDLGPSWGNQQPYADWLAKHGKPVQPSPDLPVDLAA